MNNNMKKSLPVVIIVILVMALATAFTKIDALESEIDNLRNHYASEVSILRGEINAIYDNVDEQMKAQASLLSDVQYELGELNLDWHTVDIKISVVPKMLTKDMRINVQCGAVEAELTRKENAFIGVIPVNLFTEEGEVLMTITTAEGIQTEYLDDVYIDYLWSEYLPSLYYCDISGSATFTEGKYILNGALDINCSPIGDIPNVKFTRFALTTELNGEEIGREDISEDVLNYQTYPHGVYFRDEYQKEYEVTEGDELAIYLEATDSLGYVHRMLVHYWKEHNGASAEAVNGSEMIYDGEGNLLYGKN